MSAQRIKKAGNVEGREKYGQGERWKKRKFGNIGNTKHEEYERNEYVRSEQRVHKSQEYKRGRWQLKGYGRQGL